MASLNSNFCILITRTTFGILRSQIMASQTPVVDIELKTNVTKLIATNTTTSKTENHAEESYLTEEYYIPSNCLRIYYKINL